MSVRVRVEPPDSPSYERDFDGAEIIIGRAPTAGLVITDSSASRHHVRLFERDGQWWIEDLGTRNGTWLNDQPVTEASNLRPGDRIRLGDTVVRVEDHRDIGTSGHRDIGTSGRRDIEPSGHRDIEPSGHRDIGVASSGEVEDGRLAGRLRTLNEIHRALATPISLSALLDLILERCFDVLTPEEGLIMLREKNGELRPAATRRRSESADEFFISRSIIEEVAGKGTPTLVLDATLDARFATSESIMSSGVKSVVAAPLTDADGTIGLIALSSRASVRQFTPPDLELLVSLASAAVLRVRNVALAEEAAERRVLDHELELAHDIQMSMLPRRLPERKEVEVAAWLQPARSVGGDLYDFVLDGDDLWFIVADVADKGVAAALYMAVAKTLFRAMVQARLEPAEVLGRMNRELCRDNDHMVFVTAVAGHLSLSTGQVVLSDSGHNPVLLLRPDRSLTRVALSKGVALGVVEDFAFTQHRMSLAAEDLLVLYTDGATDALNPIGDRFGTGRLDRAIRTLGGKPVDVFVPALVGTVNAFAGGAPPEDDLTVLALRYRG